MQTYEALVEARKKRTRWNPYTRKSLGLHTICIFGGGSRRGSRARRHRPPPPRRPRSAPASNILERPLSGCAAGRKQRHGDERSTAQRIGEPVAVAVPPSAPACPTPASGAVTLPQLQGAWKVRSSTGKPERGHVFLALVDAVVTIEGERLRLVGDAFDAEGRPITYPITKSVRLTPCTDPQAIALEQTPGAKGWSRVGIVALEGRVLTLSVNFPQERPPTDLRPVDDGREVVVLERM